MLLKDETNNNNLKKNLLGNNIQWCKRPVIFGVQYKVKMDAGCTLITWFEKGRVHSFLGFQYFLCAHLVCKASALWADAFYMSICPNVCVCVCLSVCLFTFEVPFKHLFAPTSQSWMSKTFRYSESLGKINGKKWYHIWKLLLMKGVKLLHNFFLLQI